VAGGNEAPKERGQRNMGDRGCAWARGGVLAGRLAMPPFREMNWKGGGERGKAISAGALVGKGGKGLLANLVRPLPGNFFLGVTGGGGKRSHRPKVGRQRGKRGVFFVVGRDGDDKKRHYQRGLAKGKPLYLAIEEGGRRREKGLRLREGEMVFSGCLLQERAARKEGGH